MLLLPLHVNQSTIHMQNVPDFFSVATETSWELEATRTEAYVVFLGDGGFTGYNDSSTAARMDACVYFDGGFSGYDLSTGAGMNAWMDARWRL